ncbi:hypothetical protein [Pseudomonas sp. S1(2024)]|uniref:hypothetical protein n=1 Tax=Pseudomonas sp. S1(2024) TaxID=3390191 RepID=UPI00397A982E
MIHRLKEPGLELVLGLIDRLPLEDSDIPALHARINSWIDQASAAEPLKFDREALERRADTRLIEVLNSINHPGDLRALVGEYKQKTHAANAFVDSEKSRDDVDHAGAHHLPGLLLVKDRIASCRNLLAIRLTIVALGVELSRKPRITVMPYEQDYMVFKHVLSVLESIRAARLPREPLLQTIAEIKQNAQLGIIASVKRALDSRAEERFAASSF